MPMRRSVSLDYRGIIIEAKVQSLTEECDLRAAVKLKGLAVDCGALPALFCEAMLIPARPRPKVKLDKDLLAPAVAAREMASNLLVGDSAKDATTINNELTKRESALISMDRSFKVEIAFMSSMAGPTGENKLREKFEALLPTSTSSRTLEASVPEATALQASDLFMFCSKFVQGEVAAACEMLNNRLQGRAPFRSSMSAVAWHMKIRTLLPNFLRVNSGPKSMPQWLVGSAALQHILKQLKGATEDTITLDALEPFHIYGWLLEEDDKEWVSDIFAKVLARTDKKSKASSSSSAAGPGAAKAKAGSKDVADAMNMFSSRR